LRSVMQRPLALLGVAFIVLFAFLGSRGLDEPDEGRYAEIGREMAATGSWWVPHLNGFEHFQKPPMLYWATAASIRLLGANEWGARLPSALAGLAVVALTLSIGWELFGLSTGLAAGLVLLSSLGFFTLARLLTPDMMLTFWIAAALACYVQYAYGCRGGKWAWLFFVALGCGFLTKGPMALVVPLCAALTSQWALRRRGEAQSLPWTGGLLVAFCIGLSWFVALSLWRKELFDYFWRYELVERFASSAHGRSKPFWFFVPVILVALLPWCFLLPKVALRAWRRLRGFEALPAEWMLLGWVVPPFIILSLSGSKLPTYILPLLPALALAFARFLTRRSSTPAWVPRVAFASLVVWLAAAAAVPWVNDRLGQQASLRELLLPLRNDPALLHARVCAVEVRSHGLEFYLRRLVCATREQSDLVLTPTPEQEKRLLTTQKFQDSALIPGVGEPPVLALVRRNRFLESFSPEHWEQIGIAGDFVLVKSHPGNLASAGAKE
jgi:4-amino-4-deoxy-L-arabinose transferase-like glycosyltransferase